MLQGQYWWVWQIWTVGHILELNIWLFGQYNHCVNIQTLQKVVKSSSQSYTHYS